MDINKNAIPAIQLNWKEYFKGFCALHGGDPVLHGGRLLFRDGWTYSSTDYAGPEFKPPDDLKSLERLYQIYWTLRKDAVGLEHTKLQQQLDGLRELQKGKDAPLQHKVISFDDSGIPTGSEIQEVDLDALVGRLTWLLSDLQECDTNILKVENNVKAR